MAALADTRHRPLSVMVRRTGARLAEAGTADGLCVVRRSVFARNLARAAIVPRRGRRTCGVHGGHRDEPRRAFLSRRGGRVLATGHPRHSDLERCPTGTQAVATHPALLCLRAP